MSVIGESPSSTELSSNFASNVDKLLDLKVKSALLTEHPLPCQVSIDVPLNDNAQSPSVTSSNDSQQSSEQSPLNNVLDVEESNMTSDNQTKITEVVKSTKVLENENAQKKIDTFQPIKMCNGLIDTPSDASNPKLESLEHPVAEGVQMPDSSSGSDNAKTEVNHQKCSDSEKTNGISCDELPNDTMQKIKTDEQLCESEVTTSSSPGNKMLAKDSNGDTDAISEVETMRELLNRSDTAIIYPEPVSDHEEESNPVKKPETKSRAPKYIHLREEKQAEESVSKADKMTVDTSTPISIHTNLQSPTMVPGSVHQNPNQKLIVNRNSCVKCGATFVLKSQLDKHLLLHSPAAQNCSICRKTFANVYRLQRHMISHDESTDLRKFKCNECGKAFKFKHHLKEHVRIHSGEKPFECQNCGKRFSHSGSYSSHMTSKKCWVMGVKMNSGSGASSVGLGITPDTKRSFASGVGAEKSQDMEMLPSAAEITLNTFYASQLQQQAVAAALLQYDSAVSAAAANTVQTQQYLAQLAATNTARSAFLPLQIGQMLTNAYAQIPNAIALESQPAQKKDENQNEKNESQLSNPQIDGQAKHLSQIKTESPSKESIDDSRLQLRCQFCEEKFTNAVDHHQHERYLCQNRENNTTIFKCTDKNSEEKDVSPNSTMSNGNPLSCKHCNVSFNGPVELHQHERYLCSQNSAINVKNEPIPASSTVPITVNKYHKSLLNVPKTPVSTESSFTSSQLEEDGDDQFVDKNGQQYRVRSMITDQQFNVLKAKYNLNPKPSSQELMEIGAQIGFPKRVVQVWFQNNRAREAKKRKGRIQPTSNKSFSDVTTSIPVTSLNDQNTYNAVSHVNYSSTSNTGMFYSNASLSLEGSPMFVASTTVSKSNDGLQEEPLDLSFKGKPKSEEIPAKASTPKPNASCEDEVLNLSLKDCSTSSQSSENSDNEIKIELRTAPLSPIACITNSVIKCETSRQEMVSPITPNAAMASPTNSDVMGTTSLENSFSSAVSMDSAGMENGSCSLINMAKRRKMLEGEGYYSGDGGDSLMIDESGTDSPLSDSAMLPGRKRSRKSWKQHKIAPTESFLIPGDNGLYSCDQCEKLFSKQSSLARHKYEHSGQRPFACNICTKSFKHKHHLTEHKRLHSGEKPFCCKKCGKRFSHSGSFSQHMNHRFKFCKQQKPESE